MVDVPFTTNTGNTLPTGCRFAIPGSFATDSIITITWTDALVTSPCGSFGYAVQLLDVAGGFTEHHFSIDHLSKSQSWTITRDSSTLYAVAFTDLHCSGGTWKGVASAASTYCPYGVQPNPDAPYNTVITTSLIELVASIALTRLGEEEKIPYVVAGLQVLAGQVQKSVDCTRLPAPNLVTNMTDFNGQHVDKLTEWFYNAAWHYFCQCVPASGGSPPPTPPPPPDVIVPPDAIVTTIPLVCDTEDLCTILNGIVQKLDSLTANVSYARRDIQIMQRQAAAFAYIPGPSFSDLSGSGELAVSDILALSVQSTTVPPTLSLISADPLEYRFLGRLSLGTADGWLRQVMLSHNPHLVLPIEGPVTRIGYSLELGVVATIQTFIGEPIG